MALFLGLGAGFLAGAFDKPSDNGAATKAGALSGVIGGVGALAGQLIGTLINGIVVGPEATAKIVEQLGLPSNSDPTAYWAGLVGSGCCFGILDLALMAGLGALGGILWWQISGKKTVAAPLQ